MPRKERYQWILSFSVVYSRLLPFVCYFSASSFCRSLCEFNSLFFIYTAICVHVRGEHKVCKERTKNPMASFFFHQFHPVNFLYPERILCSSVWEYCLLSSEQAGDLYEKIRNNQRALECYCKGGAFRKGTAPRLSTTNYNIYILSKYKNGVLVKIPRIWVHRCIQIFFHMDVFHELFLKAP